MVNFGLLTAEICWQVWGTPANFNGFRFLVALLHGTLVVGVSQTAALNRGCHLYSAGRPSRWVLAHISSYPYLLLVMTMESSAVPGHLLTLSYCFWSLHVSIIDAVVVRRRSQWRVISVRGSHWLQTPTTITPAPTPSGRPAHFVSRYMLSADLRVLHMISQINVISLVLYSIACERDIRCHNFVYYFILCHTFPLEKQLSMSTDFWSLGSESYLKMVNSSVKDDRSTQPRGFNLL